MKRKAPTGEIVSAKRHAAASIPGDLLVTAAAEVQRAAEAVRGTSEKLGREEAEVHRLQLQLQQAQQAAASTRASLEQQQVRPLRFWPPPAGSQRPPPQLSEATSPLAHAALMRGCRSHSQPYPHSPIPAFRGRCTGWRH